MESKTEMPAKRNDPNYIQIAGDVKKEIGLRFKAVCTLQQVTLGEGLEEAIFLWLEQKAKTEKQQAVG